MYSAIIVEDEMLVRIGLKSLINWDELSLELIADVSNGLEALEVYHQYKPDIIITDIRMPQMDGMELIKKVRENDRRVRIVILTCLEEFDTVRQAMGLDVDGYILKLTMTRNEMDDVLNRAIAKLREFSIPDKTVALKSKQNTDSQIRELLRQYFVESKGTAEELENGLTELGTDLRGKKTVLALMEIDHYGMFSSKYEKEGGKRVEESILNVIEEVARKNKECYVSSINASTYLIVIGVEGIASEAKIGDVTGNIISNMKNSLKRYFDLSVSFGLSSIGNDHHIKNNLYLQAATALDFKFYRGIGTVNPSDEQRNKSVVQEKINRLLVHLPLLEILGCVDEYKKRVESFLLEGSYSIERVKDFFVHILQMTALSSLVDKKVFEDIVISYTNIIYECETFDEMYAAYERFIENAVDRSKEHISYSQGIVEVIDYIKRHYNEEISLNHLAGLVKLSPNYLSALFKKELKMNFSEYIINYRIERAKELLLGTRLLAYEISQRVGFMDGAYFSRAFKKVAGSSPNEYRKKWFEG